MVIRTAGPRNPRQQICGKELEYVYYTSLTRKHQATSV